jgi:uncharacterized Zn-binding protein involved in type VI secretion
MPAVAREGDDTTTGHGCTSNVNLVVGPFSVKTRVNGKEIAHLGSKTDGHSILAGVCVPHAAQPISAASNKVRVEGIPIARVGDPVDSGAVVQGSPNVFAG